jgi:hypothetical protein
VEGETSVLPLLLRSGFGAGDPKKRLANGKSPLEFRSGGVWGESSPEVGVVGAAVSAGGEEEAGLAER